MKTIYYFIFIFVLLFYFTNCYYSSSNSGGGGGGEDSVIVPDIITIKWDANGEVIQFYTNDIAMLHGPNGATYWYPKSYESAGLTEDVIEVNTSKLSGLSGYGYGVIFCIQDVPDPVKGEFIAKNFYCVLIRVDGFFQIIKAVEHPTDPDAASVQHIMDIGGNETGWKEALDASDNNVLNQGKGVDNIVRVEIEDEDDNDVPEFNVYFNGYNIYSFEDEFDNDNGETLDIFSKDAGEYKYGFIVTLSPYESFPFVPVDVRFDQITPDYSLGEFSVNSLKNKVSKTNDDLLFFKNSTR